MKYLINKAGSYPNRIAVCVAGKEYSYHYLLRASAALAQSLLQGKPDLEEQRICLMATPGIDYVVGQWAIWRAGGIVVPLHPSHPAESLEYIIEDTSASSILVSKELEAKVSELQDRPPIQVIQQHDIVIKDVLPTIGPERKAMILYTSGTTGKPKGVVSTHGMIEAQISMLVEAWGWSREDAILNILPLHHVHGIINVLSCALYSGACCYFQPRFEADEVFDLMLKDQLTLFMAVPTIYYKLVHAWDHYDRDRQVALSAALRKLRLMVSGSAALPISTLEKWRKISGHTLLERYGMTEMGMAISNPLDGERRPGHIGRPLPGVNVKLLRERPEDSQGEILVKGPNVFSNYWEKPDATAAAFTEDGWFKTGDIAEYVEGYYRILGRSSVDIIKSGGYKISALEIEESLRSFDRISDCAVVGLPDDEWGEVVAAALVVSTAVDYEDLKRFLATKLPSYKMPRRFLEVADLPRNAMGKVTKKKVKELFA